MSNNVDNQKVSELFDAAAAAFLALSSAFRAASDAGASAGVDAKAVKTKSRTKPQPKVEDSIDQDGAEDENTVTVDEVRAALRALVEDKGMTVMKKLLKKTTGLDALGDVDPSQYPDLMMAAKKALDAQPESVEEEDAEPAKKPAAKAAKPKGVTLDQVKAAASALIDVDKPAYLAITKKLGKPSEMDESAFPNALKAYAAAMPEDDADDDIL